MSEIERRLKEIGIELPNSPSPIANYVPVVRTGDLIYLSGVGPTPKADGSTYVGKLGLEGKRTQKKRCYTKRTLTQGLLVNYILISILSL